MPVDPSTIQSVADKANAAFDAVFEKHKVPAHFRQALSYIAYVTDTKLHEEIERLAAYGGDALPLLGGKLQVSTVVSDLLLAVHTLPMETFHIPQTPTNVN